MGFCRRCGEIVTGTRCQCGGTAVAPAIPWNKSSNENKPQDKWSKTYVTRSRSVSPVRSVVSVYGPPTISPEKRFPTSMQPATTALSGRVSKYIASATSQLNRPPSPLKHSSTVVDPEADILPSITPNNTTLSKVYGSVLQPKEKWATYSCAACDSSFPPDATIYPDPSTQDSNRFLCRPCFIVNGGSKGSCPSCNKDVLILKTEGGFVHAGDRYWHKRCFTCEACFKNIGDAPMLDLLGRPSCEDCFDTCLKRDPSTPKKSRGNGINEGIEKVSNIGGMNMNLNGHRTQESSPTIEELEQRLGIVKSREGSPALEELSQRLSLIGGNINSRYFSSSGSPTTSPSYDRLHNRRNSQANTGTPRISPIKISRKSSPAPAPEAIEEMKQRLFSNIRNQADSSTLYLSRPSQQSTSTIRASLASQINESSSPSSPNPPSTPDLMSDFSDTMTQSSYSGPDSPLRGDYDDDDIFSTSKVFARGFGSRYTREGFIDGLEDIIVEETNSEIGTPTRTPKSINAISTPVSTPSKNIASSPQFNKSILHNAEESKNLFPQPSASFSCSKCERKLFALGEKGNYVTVPGNGEGVAVEMYHTTCFRCSVCDGVFNNNGKSQALFTPSSKGPCHVKCAPLEKSGFRKVLSSSSLKPAFSSPTNSQATNSPSIPTTQPLFISPARPSPTCSANSSKYERPITQAVATASPFPRFGSKTTCPGCHKSVSPMERGVVPGPQGSRWHSSCLVCGGKKEIPFGNVHLRKREEKNEGPGCGKKLDSAAKSDGEGGIWCRQCLLLLGIGGSPQVSPNRVSAPSSAILSSNSKVTSQLTGTTTIARQFTGMGGGDLALMRQLTGGGLSPTRSISPTKQLGSAIRPRPKSVIGMRSTKSIDEGRGMFLVRQMTGSTSVGGPM